LWRSCPIETPKPPTSVKALREERRTTPGMVEDVLVVIDLREEK
jgi:hypothetical protein